MPCCINPVKEAQCVFVTYEGEMTRLEIMAARYEANGLLLRKRWNRIVVNIAKLRSTPMTMELIDLASDLSSDLPASTRIALVTRPDQAEDAKREKHGVNHDSRIADLHHLGDGPED